MEISVLFRFNRMDWFKINLKDKVKERLKRLRLLYNLGRITRGIRHLLGNYKRNQGLL